MNLKLGQDYCRLTHGCGDRPFFVCFEERNVPALREKFPGDVIYSMREVAVMEKAKLDEKQLRSVHLARQEFPGATIESFLPKARKHSESGSIKGWLSAKIVAEQRKGEGNVDGCGD